MLMMSMKWSMICYKTGDNKPKRFYSEKGAQQNVTVVFKHHLLTQIIHANKFLVKYKILQQFLTI